MTPLEHLRWHDAAPFGLIARRCWTIGRLSGRIAAVWGQQRSTHEAEEPYGAAGSRPSRPAVQLDAARRARRTAVARLLDAACPSCRGLGCDACGDTGLA